jgi:type II secretory pathway component PulK
MVVRFKHPNFNIQHRTFHCTGSLEVGRSPAQRGSVLIIVLWIALGLVSITLYFANAMSFELRASDNRVSGLATEQAIDGAARYLGYVLSNLATNGAVPDATLFRSEAVPVGDAHFWLIGRDTNNPPAHPDQVFFGLVDEGSKLNINVTNTTVDMIEMLPRMTAELAANILSWRSTNTDTTVGGVGSETYALQSPPYLCKSAPFESVDELRLVYGADLATLVGVDANRNGILDPNEIDEDHNGQINPGVLECVTIYSREPNTLNDGTPRVDVSRLTANSTEFRTLLTTNFSTTRATQIFDALFPPAAPARPGARNTPTAGNSIVTSASPLDLYTRSGMTADEFAQIENQISIGTNSFIEGRININTASSAVLACLPGVTNRAQDVISYRQSNPDKLTSTAWLLEALSLSGQDARDFAQQLGDRITTHSYQFTADVAAVGPFGRGYRRVRFIFDLSEGTPKIIYRSDLTHLGWALGKTVRQTWLAKNTP